jgi:Ca-activated chloride channel family protein|tara:strand:+ start:5239 stop:6267 length:1029 start_codon:yes stop_codon:yes gene_type:complete
MKIFNEYILAEPWWLLLLLAIPCLMFLGYRQGTRGWILYPTLRVLGTLGWKSKDKPFRFAPLILPLMLVPAIVGLARPQEAKSRTSRTASGIDILIALDVSYSMSTADFFESSGLMRRPERRIEAAKKIINEFIKRRPDDRIGIVSFAARPYTVAPITLDHQILEHTLRDLALVNSRTESGTAIGSAIIAAGDRLERLKRDEEDSGTKTTSKVIVLVTDGASNSGQLSPVEAAKIVADLKIKIYPVAIGTPQGRLRGTVTGQEFDVETLKQISEITEGDFYRALDYTGLRKAFDSIDELEKTEVKRNTWIIRKELYPWFVGPSALLILGFIAYTAFNPPPMP